MFTFVNRHSYPMWKLHSDICNNEIGSPLPYSIPQCDMCLQSTHHLEVDRTGQFSHHPSASPAVIMWGSVGQQQHFLNTIPTNFMVGTGWKVCCDRGAWALRADHTGRFWHHVLATSVVKSGGPTSNSEHNPNNSTVGTRRKVCCDRGMSLCLVFSCHDGCKFIVYHRNPNLFLFLFI